MFLLIMHPDICPPGDKRHQLSESEREVWDSEGYFPQTRMYMEIWEHFYNKTKAVVNINSSIKYSSTTSMQEYL